LEIFDEERDLSVQDPLDWKEKLTKGKERRTADNTIAWTANQTQEMAHISHASHLCPEQREAHPLNTLEHFCDNHANCPVDHPNLKLRVFLAGYPTGQEELRAFLAQTAKLIRQTRKDLSAQLCEFFNAVKAHFANKTYSWKFSWPVRAMGAVVQLNTPESWKFELFRACRVPGLHESTIRLLAGRAAEEVEQHSSRRTSEFEARERTRGLNNRETAGKQTSGRRDSHLAAPSVGISQESGEGGDR
jgi:hypothetical protein